MSVIIKSNMVAKKHLGSIHTIGSSPQDKFDEYKSRVQADGGVITDPVKTLNAFKMLFNNALLGKMTTFVSGFFGVKKDSSGNLDKLYAIDGEDMVVKVYNSGSKPRLDASNNIDFTTNNTGATLGPDLAGSMFETAPIADWVVDGEFGFANYLDANLGDERSYASGIQPSSREYGNSKVYLTTIGSPSYIETNYSENSSGTIRLLIRSTSTVSTNKPVVVTFSNSASTKLYRDDVLIAINESVIDASVFDKPVVHVFGGMVGSSSDVGFYQGKAKAYFAFSKITDEQVSVLSNYRL